MLCVKIRYPSKSISSQKISPTEKYYPSKNTPSVEKRLPLSKTPPSCRQGRLLAANIDNVKVCGTGSERAQRDINPAPTVHTYINIKIHFGKRLPDLWAGSVLNFGHKSIFARAIFRCARKSIRDYSRLPRSAVRPRYKWAADDIWMALLNTNTPINVFPRKYLHCKYSQLESTLRNY